jgi:hypothetical protein
MLLHGIDVSLLIPIDVNLLSWINASSRRRCRGGVEFQELKSSTATRTMVR